jgi:trigger factor
VENMDFTTIDFMGYIDGAPFAGGKGEDYPLRVGSKTFIPGFEEQLLGAKTGETRSEKVTFPAEYQSKELAGKEATFDVTVKSVKRRQLPAIDDDFVKDISEEWDTVAEMRQGVKAKLQEKAEKDAEQAMKNASLEGVVSATDFFIPEVMIEQQVDDMIENLNHELGAQGMNVEQYCKLLGQTPEAVREQFKPKAEKTVRMELVLEAVADAEDIKAEDADLDYYINEMAGGSEEQAAKIKEELVQSQRMFGLAYNIRMVKAADFVYDNAQIIDAAQEEDGPVQDAAEKPEEKTEAEPPRPMPIKYRNRFSWL